MFVVVAIVAAAVVVFVVASVSREFVKFTKWDLYILLMELFIYFVNDIVYFVYTIPRNLKNF